MKFDLDPTIPRVVAVAVVIFLTAFLTPLYAIVQGGDFPTTLQLLTFLIGAVLVVVEYWATFIKGDSS